MSGRMNWSAANNRRRVREQGAETVDGLMIGSKAPNVAADQQPKARRKVSPLTEAIIIDKWWKNRGGEAVYVRLSPYEGQTLIDIRTWFMDKEGISRPGKGFACTAKHLPQLVKALTKALATAQEFGVIDDEGAE